MYNTEKRVAQVKKRIMERHCRQERGKVCCLSALCAFLFLSLVGALGMVQGQPVDAAGMYGAILLHEDAGGYVLVAVISFTVAVVMTVLCVRFRERERRGQGTEIRNVSWQQEDKNR